MSFFQAELWGNSLLEYSIFIAVVLGSVIAGKIIYKIFKTTVRRLTKRTETILDDVLVDMIEEPLVMVIVLLGLWQGVKALTLSENMDLWIGRIFSILVIANITWFIARFVDSVIEHYLVPSQNDSQVAKHLLPIAQRTASILIWAIGIIFIISNLGYEITSLVAGLGIGGLAIAMAVKDLLSHMFGGATVLTDKPFKIGDRIKVAGYDGFVKEIGVRSTRIETFDGTQIVIPNGVIANETLENVSKERARRVRMLIGLEYSTSAKQLEKAKSLLEKIILENDKTDDKSIVVFSEFGDFALKIMVIYWIKDLSQILQTKDEINMEIKRRFDRAKLSMAFPTQTVHVKR